MSNDAALIVDRDGPLATLFVRHSFYGMREST